MQFPYGYTPVAGAYSPAERDEMFGKIRNADTPGNLVSYNGVLALAPRPNLLDNAYFVGGGSGYGVFPVNQRYPLTQFSEAGNIFDRWKLVSGTATLTAAGLVLNGTITQTISPAPDGVLTCSALTTAGLVTPTYSNGVFTLTGTGQTFLAAKLERGSIQTLAQQESGAWALNEIPRYDDELRKCQAYLLPIPANEYLIATGRSSSAVRFLVPTPVTMAGNVQIIAPNYSIYAYNGSSYDVLTDFTLSILAAGTGGGGVTISAGKSGHGLRGNPDVFFVPGADAYLSAESN